MEFVQPDHCQPAWAHLSSQETRRWCEQCHTKAQHLVSVHDYSAAHAYSLRGFELAKSLILRPQPSGTNDQRIAEDFIAFGASALLLAECWQQRQQLHQARAVLADSQQQLWALLPLYVTSDGIDQVIAAVIHRLGEQSAQQKSALH